MPVPSYTKIWKPLLVAIAERGGSARARDLYSSLADEFELTPEQRAEKRADGVKVAWENEVQWARNELRKMEYVDENAGRGIWKLSEKGLTYLVDERLVLPEQAEKLQSALGFTRKGSGKSTQRADPSALPTQTAIMDPLLQVIAQHGGCVQAAKVYEPLADHFGLAAEVRQLPSPDGHGTLWQNRVRWARAKLVESGELDNSKRRYWTLTEKGWARIGLKLPSTNDPDCESEPSMVGYQAPSFDALVQSIQAQGLVLSEQLIRRYHLALQSRKFVILAGVSGTGKTWLAEAYAASAGARCCLVAVAPNWNSNEDLLGFFNPFGPSGGTFQETSFTTFLREAADADDRARAAGVAPVPYHLILDEMNLARVEYYFARFLSAMEIRARSKEAHIDLAPGAVVKLPPNLYFIGTINVDETTQGFADKIYDRAQLIELEATRQDLEQVLGDAPFADRLMSIWDAVHHVAPFAFRVMVEIREYVKAADELGCSWQDALDEQLLQKVLPKFRGGDSSTEEALTAFTRIAAQEHPLSHRKATQMLVGCRNHGFVSYF